MEYVFRLVILDGVSVGGQEAKSIIVQMLSGLRYLQLVPRRRETDV